ncbi:MAG: primosomal protein N' (replication factor Y) (superfamily II helicase) [Puniceicoccaceae bacterium 5H]|nr:MAG: primosomal protein N' (replication factor Y) (superfamily II helicase) [Puniceicoccaceae bacterium 5H]
MPERTDTISVRLLTRLDRELGYRLPEALAGQVQVGSLVKVPVVRRVELAVVTSLETDPSFPLERLKYVHSLEQPFPVLTLDLLKLAQWMERYYAADLNSIFETMIPSSVRRGMKVQQRKFVSLARQLEPDELAHLEKRAPRQAQLYTFLRDQLEQRPLPKALLIKRLKTNASTVDALVAKGVLSEEQQVVQREAYADELAGAERMRVANLVLNEEQQTAAEALVASIDQKKFIAHLLHGVTGSGKTEVYLHALRHVLQEGGGVIFLVPEVALTPQTVGRLRARLEAASGEQAVVWHSLLSDGERYDAWHALSTGEARVVVGARSAIFAPIQDLRLIIVDEEHEPAYKQEETPRYHGRDVAVYRAMLNQATVVLGSATPALESLYNARQGKYQLNKLTQRVDNRQLPLVHVVDMRREQYKSKGPPLFSRLLADKLYDRLEKGEQSILFINRRGYDSSVRCPDCGWVAYCEHCAITLTHHRHDNTLRCHLCGAEHPVPQVCPECKSPKIHYRGSGTQKIEDFARRLLPSARVLRIDADTMQQKHRFREVLNDFRAGKVDILVGTQMIAKGLDFPNVTLVGLLDADLTMHLPDFRSMERTFQLLVQVAGRSGRGERAGEVVVQTYLPFSEPIQFGRQQDFDGFAEDELGRREEFQYPPFQHLVHHLLRGPNPDKVAFYAKEWAKFLEQELLPHEPNLEIRGPAPCPVEKIKDHYRFQIWYFTPNTSRLVPKLQALRTQFKWDPEVIEVLDVDAVNLI